MSLPNGVLLSSALGLATLSTGCSALVDPATTQCGDDSDCAGAGEQNLQCLDGICIEAEADVTPFSCRDEPWPAVGDDVVEYELRVADLVQQQPLADLVVVACANLDANCESPIAEAVSDETGAFTLSLTEGFRGHLHVPPPATDPPLAPLYAHLYPPPSNDPDVPVRADLAVTHLAVVAGLAMLAGIPMVAGTGHVFFTAIDCQGNPLSGVTITPALQTEETLVSYLGASGQPDLALIGTGPAGQGSILNLPPGFVTIRGVHESEGLVFEQSAVIRPDTITSVPIVPSPT